MALLVCRDGRSGVDWDKDMILAELINLRACCEATLAEIDRLEGLVEKPSTKPFAGVCPLCAHALDAEGKCKSHGPQIPAGVKYMRVCRACGHQFEGTANICPECNAA